MYRGGVRGLFWNKYDLCGKKVISFSFILVTSPVSRCKWSKKNKSLENYNSSYLVKHCWEYDSGYLHRILRILRQVYPVTNKPKFSLQRYFQFSLCFVSLSVNWTIAQNTTLSDSLFSLEREGKANSRARENLPRAIYAFPRTLKCFTFT